MKFFSIKLVLFLLLSGLSLSEKDYQLRDEVVMLPDEVTVYWINPLSNSLVAVNCEDLKEKYSKKLTIDDFKEVQKLYEYVQNTENLNPLEHLKGQRLDSRVLIEFTKQGELLDQICWSYQGVEKNNIIYESNIGLCEVEAFLFNHKISVRFE